MERTTGEQRTGSPEAALIESTVPDTQTGRNAFKQLVSQWKKDHASVVDELTSELQEPGAQGSEKALAKAVAHDLVVLNKLGDSELALTRQIAMFAEAGNSKHIPMLVRSLAELSKLRTEATRRTTELMKVTATLAARRRQQEQEGARGSHLRRVV